MARQWAVKYLREGSLGVFNKTFTNSNTQIIESEKEYEYFRYKSDFSVTEIKAPVKKQETKPIKPKIASPKQLNFLNNAKQKLFCRRQRRSYRQ